MTERSERAIDTWSALHDGIVEVIDQAGSTLLILDPDLSETGLESATGIDALRRLLLRSPQPHAIRVLLQDAGFVERHAPRLQVLLGERHPKIEIRLASDPRALPDAAFVIADGSGVVIRFHHARPRGKLCSDDSGYAAQYAAQFESLWESATPGPSSLPLGL